MLLGGGGQIMSILEDSNRFQNNDYIIKLFLRKNILTLIELDEVFTILLEKT